MSFNKKYLPSLETLQEDYENFGEEEFFAKYIKKVDAFIGSSEALDYIEKVRENKYKNEQNK